MSKRAASVSSADSPSSSTTASPTAPASAPKKRITHHRERSYTLGDLDAPAADLIIPPEEWQAKVLRTHPDVLYLRERLHLMLGEDSFARKADVSLTEVTDSIHPDIVMALIDGFLAEQGFEQARATLRTETDALRSSNPVLMSEKLEPHDLIRLVRLGMKPDLFDDPDYSDNDPELESLESYAGVSDPDVNIWLEETSPDTIITDPDSGRIIAATVNQLIIQVTSTKARDVDYRRCFFGTLHSFSTPTTILRKLIQRYRPPRQATRGAGTQQSPAVQTPVEPSIIVGLIMYWLDTFPYDFTDAVHAQLQKFIDNDLMADGHINIAHKLQTCLTRLEETKALKKAGATALAAGSTPFSHNTVMPKKHTAPEPKVPKNIFSPSLTLADVDEEEIARQLTLLDFETYSGIQVPELLKKRWVLKNGKNAKRVVALLNRANTISRWVAVTLARELPHTKDKNNVRVLSRFVKLAEHLRALNNFHSLLAVVSGWQSSLVHSLVENTKKELPKSLLESMENIEYLLDPTKRYKGYRQLFASVPLPSIPCLAPHLQDLAWIEETVPDRYPDKEKLINWEKRMIHQICELLNNLDQTVQQLSADNRGSEDEEGDSDNYLETHQWMAY